MSSTSSKFTIGSTCSAARTGVLNLAHGEMQTPAVMLMTRFGTPSFMLPDLVATLDNCLGFQLNLTDVISRPGVDTMEKYVQAVPEGSFNSFCNLNQAAYILTTRDPEALISNGGASTDFSFVKTDKGKMKVTPEQLMKLVSAGKPDAYVALSDEIEHSMSKKRAKKSQQRSEALLNQTLELHEQLEQNPLLFAPVQGTSGESRKAAAESVQELSDKLDGFVLGGLGTGETREEREETIQTCLEILDQEKPRIAQGLGSPSQILHAVMLGIDIFDSNYAVTVTSTGGALIFPFEVQDSMDSEENNDIEKGEQDDDPFKINLHNRMYENDKGPLMQGCTCFACQNHTRSYIHHLVRCQEMLADTLLAVHNHHHFSMFMVNVRAHIENGTLEKYAAYMDELTKK